MKIGLFPGQGIPVHTTLEALTPGSELLDRFRSFAGYDLRDALAEAVERTPEKPPTTLMQPAIFTAGLIAWNEQQPHIHYLAGHSLGEYTALVAAGSLSFEDALGVLEIRSRAMDSAGCSVPGGMAAILNVERNRVIEIARRAAISVANDNAPNQIVLAGSFEGLDSARALTEEAGGRFVALEVAGPFHTDAIRSAVPVLERVLREVIVRTPRVPVISNVTARPVSEPRDIKELLVRNLVQGVRWRESLEWAWNRGVRETVDLGPGRVVGSLARQTFAALGRTQDPVRADAGA